MLTLVERIALFLGFTGQQALSFRYFFAANPWAIVVARWVAIFVAIDLATTFVWYRWFKPWWTSRAFKARNWKASGFGKVQTAITWRLPWTQSGLRWPLTLAQVERSPRFAWLDRRKTDAAVTGFNEHKGPDDFAKLIGGDGLATMWLGAKIFAVEVFTVSRLWGLFKTHRAVLHIDRLPEVVPFLVPADLPPMTSWLGHDSALTDVAISHVKTPAVLVIGPTGTGKTVALRCGIQSCWQSSGGPEDQVDCWLLDPKRGADFKDLPAFQHPNSKIFSMDRFSDYQAFVLRMEALCSSFGDAMDAKGEAGVAVLDTSRQAGNQVLMRRTIIVIDEARAALDPETWPGEDSAKEWVARLVACIKQVSSMFRATGSVALWLASQRGQLDEWGATGRGKGIPRENFRVRLVAGVSSEMSDRLLESAAAADPSLCGGKWAILDKSKRAGEQLRLVRIANLALPEEKPPEREATEGPTQKRHHRRQEIKPLADGGRAEGGRPPSGDSGAKVSENSAAEAARRAAPKRGRRPSDG